MSKLGHSTIDLLKLDIEGAEYQVIDSLLSDRIYPKILCLEFDEGHTPKDYFSHFRILRAIKKIKSRGYKFTVLDGWNATFLKCSAK